MSDSFYPSFIGDTHRLDQAFERIIQALRTRNAQFLFGAGMSESSGIPIGLALINKLLKVFFPSSSENPPNDEELKKLAHAYPIECIVEAVENMPGPGRSDLTGLLESIFIEPEYRLSSAHHDFQSVCLWGGSPRLYNVFTTNFDMLLEKALGHRLAVPVTEKNAKYIKEINQNGKICIIHLHGRLDEDYKITETDVYDKTYRVLNNEFRSALTTSDAFVFVGYSLNDPDFRDVYMDFRREILDRKTVNKETYFVSPAEDEHHYKLGKAVWDARGAIWIPLKADDFFAKLKLIMDSGLRRNMVEKAMEKYHYKDDAAFEEFVNKTAKLFQIDHDEAVVLLNEIPKPSGGGA